MQLMDISDKFVVVTITHDETKIWATGIEKGKKPERIFSPEKTNHHHFRTDQKTKGSKVDAQTIVYYEEIAASITSASQILLIGHGHAKASSMLHLIQYLERKHPVTAHKIVDALDENLAAMSEPEVLKLARAWFDKHQLMI